MCFSSKRIILFYSRFKVHRTRDILVYVYSYLCLASSSAQMCHIFPFNYLTKNSQLSQNRISIAIVGHINLHNIQFFLFLAYFLVES